METGSAKRWPLESVLEMVGLTREEWDCLTEGVEADNLPVEMLFEIAMKKGTRRRRDESARRQR